MKKVVRFQTLVLILVTALVLQACTTAQRVHEGSEVAKEGVELTKILPKFYDAYYRSAIRADSVTLEVIRRGSPPEELKAQLERSNTQLKQTGTFVDQIKDHVALLREYFEAIGALTDDDVGEDLGSSTADLVDGIASTREEIFKTEPLGLSLEKAAKPSGNFVVVALKSKALKDELEAHGAAIEADLQLQETLLNALGQTMAGDRSAWVTARLKDPLFTSYESRKPELPRRWVENRVEYLTQPSKVAITTEAKDAMAELLVAWRELADGGPKKSTLMRLRDRVDATGKLVGALAR